MIVDVVFLAAVVGLGVLGGVYGSSFLVALAAGVLLVGLAGPQAVVSDCFRAGRVLFGVRS